MKRSWMRVTALLLMLAVVPMRADGKFFSSIPADTPYQRALIVHVDGVETLVVQSRWLLGGTDADRLGWVVPVPMVPQLGSMNPHAADELFRGLFYATDAHWFSSTDVIMVVLTGAEALLVMSILVLSVWRFIRDSRRLARIWRYTVGASIVNFVVCFVFMPACATLGTYGSLEVLEHRQVGAYDVAVVRAEDPAEMLDWLTERGFAFDTEDARVIAAYVERGWCFTTARLHQPEVEKRGAGPQPQRVFDFTGMVAPLILRFPSEQAVYPLALTGSTATETEVHLFLLSDNRLRLQEEVPLELYCAERNDHIRKVQSAFNDDPDAKPLATFASQDLFLHSWRGILTPQKMRKDLTFAPADDQSGYRRVKFHW